MKSLAKKICSFKKQLQVLFLNYADLEEIIKCLMDLLPIMMVKNHNMCQKHIDCSYAHQIAFFMMVDLVNQCKSINGKKKNSLQVYCKKFQRTWECKEIMMNTANNNRNFIWFPGVWKLRKLYLSAKFPHQEIRLNYGIFRSGTIYKKFPWKKETRKIFKQAINGVYVANCML